MERIELNKKTWYRGIKVIFVLFFIFAQGLGFLITYSMTSEKISFVKCDNGKEFENPYLGLKFYESINKNDLSKRCGWQNLESLSFKDKVVPVNLPYSQISKPKYSIFEKIGFYALSFVVVSVIFWLISRAFFYVFVKEKFLRSPVK